MIGTKPGQREPGRIRRWWTAITKGRHSTYVMVDIEKYALVLPKGAVVREAAVLPTGTLLMAIDMTFAEGTLNFQMQNRASRPPPSGAPGEKKVPPPEFPQHGPVEKQ